ncbi:MAG: rod shape-determining protein MreC [Leptolyngbya sp. SIO4C1]|nr:rod shape-determining protein MreC [Leptolyngbya sp. SIO4C1]
MFTLRRWWDRYAVKAGLVVLAIGCAWTLRQTDGALVYEAYQLLTRPLQPGLSRAERLENAYVLELQERVVELENQNQKLRELIDYESKTTRPSILAAVIGRSADNWWQQVTLNKGSRDQVKAGDVVTGPGGVIGRVVATSANTSRVLLVSDPTSQIGVKVSRSRSMGVVRGQSDGRIVMEFFDKVPDVKPGDVIVTSSYSRLFPKDIPVGRVESIDLEKGPAPQAIIQLSSPLNILEWATIHPFEPIMDVDAPPARIVDDEDER